MTVPMELADAVALVRREVADLHAELPRNGLVAWTAGNVSARVRGADLFVIKPSGVFYDELTPDNMVVCDLDGNLVEGDHAPSSDTAAHAYVYRHLPEVNGVVHTHSPYATAWAARGEPIPCVLTMMGDEFGGEVPIGPFALIGDDSIGAGIVASLRRSRSRAVLMQNHGPFTVGVSARAAVKAAVLCEEVARTVHLARQLGEPLPSRRTSSTPSSTATRTSTANPSDPSKEPADEHHSLPDGLVPDRQPGPLRPRRAGPGGAAVPPGRRPAHRQRPAGAGGLAAGADRRRRHPRPAAGGQCRPGLHRGDRLDAHLLPGQDVDPRADRAGEAAAAPAHPGQPAAALVEDRHGLHE